MKEKMISGQLYNPNVPELIKAREYAKNLCCEYNFLKPTQTKEKNLIIKKLFGYIGDNFLIEQNFFCDYGFNIFAGKNFYINHNCVILDCAKVTFGDNVFIGPNCGFYTAEHPINAAERNKFIEFAKPITIKSNVWLGGNVCVIGGVTIGVNSVIGAGSVVIKDIPDNVLAVGNPATPIKKL